jgi:hypothetical protein
LNRAFDRRSKVELLPKVKVRVANEQATLTFTKGKSKGL